MESTTEKLGEVLVSRGKLDAANLDRALKVQESARVELGSTEKLGSILTRLGMVSSRDLAEALAHQRGWIIVDAGWMALSRDRGTQKQAIDRGYGVVCDATGQVLDDWMVTGANQEHGIVAHSQERARDDIEKLFPIGTRLRILPNHACATGAQHGNYHVLRGTDASGTWPRFGGW